MSFAPRQFARASSLAVTASAAALLLGACGGSEEQHEQSPSSQTGGKIDLVVGSLVPLSGALGDFGASADTASQLAIEQLEQGIESSGVGGSVELITGDGRTDPQRTADSIRTMVEEESASCIVGPWSSAEVIDVARSIAIPKSVLLISPAATLDAITSLEDDGLVNRTAPPDSSQGPPLAAAIADDLGGAGGKTVDIAARKDSYGEALASTFERAWQAEGGEIGTTVLYEPASSDFTGVAERLTEDPAEALVVIDFAIGFARLAAALDETGKYDPNATWSFDLLASTELSSAVGIELIEGLRGTVPGVPDDQPATKAFARLFEDAEPRLERQVFDAQTFDAVILCYLAAVAAGTTDGELMGAALAATSGPGGERYTWEQLPDAIEALEAGKAIDYQGASGPIDLNAAGDPTAGVYDIFRYEDGKLVLYDERPLGVGAGR